MNKWLEFKSRDNWIYPFEMSSRLIKNYYADKCAYTDEFLIYLFDLETLNMMRATTPKNWDCIQGSDNKQCSYQLSDNLWLLNILELLMYGRQCNCKQQIAKLLWTLRIMWIFLSKLIVCKMLKRIEPSLYYSIVITICKARLKICLREITEYSWSAVLSPLLPVTTIYQWKKDLIESIPELGNTK